VYYTAMSYTNPGYDTFPDSYNQGNDLPDYQYEGQRPRVPKAVRWIAGTLISLAIGGGIVEVGANYLENLDATPAVGCVMTVPSSHLENGDQSTVWGYDVQFDGGGNVSKLNTSYADATDLQPGISKLYLPVGRVCTTASEQYPGYVQAGQ
jgi:hypothetical protein